MGDYNKADVLSDAPIVFQVGNNFFCVVFTVEISARLLAFERKRNAFQHLGFMFDFTLVLLMAWETWVHVLMYKILSHNGSQFNPRSLSVLRIFRVFRLLRVFRMARVL